MRSIVAVIELPKSDAEGKLTPAGIPVATGFRVMGRWEYLLYRVKKWFRRKRAPRIKTLSDNCGGISVGVRISAEAYDCLLGRKQPIKDSLFEAECYEMEFVPPPAHKGEGPITV